MTEDEIGEYLELTSKVLPILNEALDHFRKLRIILMTMIQRALQMNVGFVKITRGKDPENKSTFGKVEVLDGNLKVVWTGSSMERPWKDNKNDESCIPAGLYRLKKRVSPIVDKTSGGEFKEGWEVTDVQGRTFIMFHVGNYVRNSNGCVLIGTKDCCT